MQSTTEREDHKLTVQDFYELQVKQPNHNACELFWTGACGDVPPPLAIYPLGIPCAPPPGKSCHRCKQFRNLSILTELVECEYEVDFDGKNYSCTKNTYVDDGYGNYGTAQVEITVTKRGNVRKITVDGMTKKQLEREANKTRNQCSLWRKRKMCANDEETTDWKEDELGECGDCSYLDLLESLISQLEDGGW